MTGDAEHDKRRRSPLAVGLIVGAVLLPVLYALSVGPCRWLYFHGYLGEQPEAVIQAFYWPLNAVANLSPPLRSALFWYSTLWGE
jgi:hypothetical protein